MNISKKIHQQIINTIDILKKITISQANNSSNGLSKNFNFINFLNFINLETNQITIPLYLIAPSGYAETEKLNAAAAFFKNFKLNILINEENWQISFELLEPRFSEISTRRHQRFGGDLAQRCADFDFQNIPKHAMVMPVRGGYGFSELLPHLNWQEIQQHIQTKKLFVLGYSDFTLFHLANLKYQLNNNQNITPTFLGPMFAADFYYQPEPSEYTILSLILNYLKYQTQTQTQTQTKIIDHLENLDSLDNLNKPENPQKNILFLKRYQENETQNLDDDGCYRNNINCQPYDNQYNQYNEYTEYNNLNNLNNLNKFNKLQGKLWGGNLAMLCHALGTPAFLDPTQYQQQILILEDIGEAPYAIDRMFYQLYYAGVLNSQKAVILGQFSNYKTTDYDNGFNLSTVFNKWQSILNKEGVELLTGLNFGHTYHKQTLAVGVEYEIYFK